MEMVHDIRLHVHHDGLIKREEEDAGEDGSNYSMYQHLSSIVLEQTKGLAHQQCLTATRAYHWDFS